MIKFNREKIIKITNELDKLNIEIIKIGDITYDFSTIGNIELNKSTQALEELKNIITKSNKIIENYREIKNMRFDNIRIKDGEQLLKIAGIIFENIGTYDAMELYRSFWFLWKILLDSLNSNEINFADFLAVKNYNGETLAEKLDTIIREKIKIRTGKPLDELLESYYCKSNTTYNTKKIEKYIIESCKSWLPGMENKCSYLKNNKTKDIRSICVQQVLCFRSIVCTGHEIINGERFADDLNDLISNLLIYYDYLGRKSMEKFDEITDRRDRENVNREFVMVTRPQFSGIPEINMIESLEERRIPMETMAAPSAAVPQAQPLLGGYQKDRMYIDFLNSLNKDIYLKDMQGRDRKKLTKILKKYRGGIYSKEINKILNKMEKI